MILFEFFYKFVRNELVLSKPGVRQNCTAQEVDRHAPLIAYSSSSKVFHSVPPGPKFRFSPLAYLLTSQLKAQYFPYIAWLAFHHYLQ